MAIDAKMSFLRQIEQCGAETIPQATMQKMMVIISDVLEGFDIREHEHHWEAEEQDDLFEAFLATMKVQGRSKGTIARYERMIKIFMAFTKTTTRKINVYHVRAWLAAEKNRGIQDSTLDGNRQVLSSYFGWLFREGLIERNPMSNVGTIKVPKKKKPTYSPVDMAKIMDACRKLRDKAMIQFMARHGTPIQTVAHILGHEKIDTTMEYVQQSAQDIKYDYRRLYA